MKKSEGGGSGAGSAGGRPAAEVDHGLAGHEGRESREVVIDPASARLIRYLDAPQGATRGYMALLPRGAALWCGEMGLTWLREQTQPVQDALGGDFGWCLAERRSHGRHSFGVLAKVADEETGLRLLHDMVRARVPFSVAELDILRTPPLTRIIGANRPIDPSALEAIPPVYAV